MEVEVEAGAKKEGMDGTDGTREKSGGGGGGRDGWRGGRGREGSDRSAHRLGARDGWHLLEDGWSDNPQCRDNKQP